MGGGTEWVMKIQIKLHYYWFITASATLDSWHVCSETLSCYFYIYVNLLVKKRARKEKSIETEDRDLI